MNKVLILGTNAGQADIIRYFKSIDWEVHACGYKREGVGVGLADYFHLANTINVDEIVDLAKKLEVDLIYSVSSDTNIRTATKASEILHLPVIVGSEIVELFHHKDQLREFLNKTQINEVGFKKITSLEEARTWNIFPCVVKPTDSQGQRGVELVEEKTLFENAVKLALQQSATNTVILEEYLVGVEFGSNVIVQNNKIVASECTERLVHGKDYFGLPKGHTLPPVHISKEEITEAEKIISDLVQALKLEKAVLYVQMVATPKGVKIIEVAPRLDGCHIWRLIKLAKGYDLCEYAVNLLTNQTIEHTETNTNNELYTLEFHQIKADEVFNESNVPTPPNTLFNEYRYTNGEEVVPINGTLEVVGYYVYKECNR